MDNDPNIPPEMAGVFLGVMCFALIIALIVTIFFLLTLQKALSRCSPRNRTMEPGQVWLNLVPFVNIVWQFITVARVAESLKNEFRARGRDDGGDYGYGLGMAYCVIGIVNAGLSVAGNVVPMLDWLGIPVVIVGMICGIVYWVKIAGYSGQIASRAQYDDEYDDEDDDRPRRGRDRDDDRDDDDGRSDRPWNRGR